MNRDHIVFAISGFLLGLVVGSFLLGPRLARSRLAGVSPDGATLAAPAVPAGAVAANAAGGPMAEVMRRLEALKQRVAGNPRDFDALVELAALYMDAAKYPQAIDYYERALAFRNEPAIRTDLGICYKQSGRNDKALAEFQRAVADRPELWQARYNLAIVFAETGRKDEARSEIAALKKLDVAPAQIAELEKAVEGR